MHKRGGMERVDREGSGVVLRPGSRFRVPQLRSQDALSHPGPAALAYRVRVATDERRRCQAGQPMMQARVVTKTRGQAYRVLEPSSSRFRMRARFSAASGPDPRFHLAGRGGPKVILSEDDED